MEEATGDLDKDGIAEKAIVYNTSDTSETGTVRELRIFKQTNAVWKLWKSSKNAILKSEEGGMMGDPFGTVRIENGILLIEHSGGSSWKWNYTDKYRYQNGAFELIGFSTQSGKPCEYWVGFDFNVTTGKIIYKKQFESCENDDQKIYKEENETFYYKKAMHLNLNNRHDQNIKITSPKYKEDLYL